MYTHGVAISDNDVGERGSRSRRERSPEHSAAGPGDTAASTNDEHPAVDRGAGQAVGFGEEGGKTAQ